MVLFHLDVSDWLITCRIWKIILVVFIVIRFRIFYFGGSFIRDIVFLGRRKETGYEIWSNVLELYSIVEKFYWR